MREPIDLTVTRFIPLSPARVFRLWTDPEELIQWWGPPGVECPAAEIDLRVGGRYRIANRFRDGTTIWIHGEYELIDPPTRLRFTWQIGEAATAIETVTVKLTGVDGGTRVEILHAKVPDKATHESHLRGWQGCLDGLENWSNRLNAAL